MKRFLIFLILFFVGIFLPWQTVVFMGILYALYFLFPAELVFYGIFLDSALRPAPPSLFTFGFLAVIISSEFLKSFVKTEQWLGKVAVAGASSAAFAAVYFLIK